MVRQHYSATRTEKVICFLTLFPLLDLVVYIIFWHMHLTRGLILTAAVLFLGNVLFHLSQVVRSRTQFQFIVFLFLFCWIGLRIAGC